MLGRSSIGFNNLKASLRSRLGQNPIIYSIFSGTRSFNRRCVLLACSFDCLDFGQQKLNEVSIYKLRFYRVSACKNPTQTVTFQVRVEGIDYVGVGSGASKKDAQTLCARDMVRQLVQLDYVQQSEVPSVMVGPFVQGG